MSSPAEDSDRESTAGDEPEQAEETTGRPQHGVRRKLHLRTLTFGRRRKDNSKKRKSPWALKFGPRSWHSQNFEVSESAPGGSSCVGTVYRRTGTDQVASATSDSSNGGDQLESVVPRQWGGPIDDWDERARMQRAREIEEGVDPPPGYQPRHEQKLSELSAALCSHLSPSVSPYPYLERLSEAAGLTPDLLAKLCEMTMESLSASSTATVHTQVDYIHCLVPDMLEITNCGFYWGKMDRYEAEQLLEGKPEGTFLLRDSAQEDFLFSVSFRRYGRSLHARVEQWNHAFSFDTHDPGVFASGTVCGLIEHYKDPSCCMYFEPMLTIPLHRTFAFSLQHLCRAAICSRIGYDAIGRLVLPKSLKSYLKEYHYKQRVKVRNFDQ